MNTKTYTCEALSSDKMEVIGVTNTVKFRFTGGDTSQSVFLTHEDARALIRQLQACVGSDGLVTAPQAGRVYTAREVFQHKQRSFEAGKNVGREEAQEEASEQARTEASGQFINILALTNNELRPSPRPYVHADRSYAEVEARRLSKANPGQTFVTFRAISRTNTPAPTPTTTRL